MFYQLANLPEDSYQVARPKRTAAGAEGSNGLPQVPLEGEGEEQTEVRGSRVLVNVVVGYVYSVSMVCCVW